MNASQVAPTREHRAIPCFALAVLLVLCASVASTIEPRAPQSTAPRLALDHVVVAVNNLDAAASQFRAMGFSLKPGRPHDNGIRNWHAKFKDGTEVELLTAPEARDDLTRKYRRHLAEGDGAAFLALFPGKNAEAPATEMPDYIFFSRLNHSPTDKPEHFAHSNSADSLVGVWVADPSFGGALAKALRLNPAANMRRITNPLGWEGLAFPLERSEVVLVPIERQLIKNRPIVGVVLRVKSLAQAEAVLRKGGIAARRVKDAAGLEHVLISPDTAHGVWLDLIENWGLLAPKRPGAR